MSSLVHGNIRKLVEWEGDLVQNATPHLFDHIGGLFEIAFLVGSGYSFFLM